jgi:hypothetical protein
MTKMMTMMMMMTAMNGMIDLSMAHSLDELWETFGQH